MTTIELQPGQADSAAKIQSAIDGLARGGGGRLILPEMTLTLDRGLELSSNIELIGQGPQTILRKGPGRIYPMTGYHNYGMCDVPLVSAAGLMPGMTVSIHDNCGRGFSETFARITWIDGNWVGLDRGLGRDYMADSEPRLTTCYSMIFGDKVANVAVRNLALEGSREDQATHMGSCRGAAMAFSRGKNIEISNVSERNYHGEGLGLVMSCDIRISDCHFCQNSGNGMHPGAGTANVLFERCVSSQNGQSGFFFCVRACYVTLAECRFEENDLGVSVGTRDCNNVIKSCLIAKNRGPGVLFRRDHPVPAEAHSVVITGCELRDNCATRGPGQVAIEGFAHDVIMESNAFMGCRHGNPDIFAAEGVRNLFCAGNRAEKGAPDIQVQAASLTNTRPAFRAGYGSADESAVRHIKPHLP